MLYFCFAGNFSILDCCEDCKKLIRDKKFLQSRFFCLLFGLRKSLLKYSSFLNLGLEKFHFLKYKKSFQSSLFSLFELGKFFPETWGKYEARKLHFGKYKGCFHLGAIKFHFFKYKKFFWGGFFCFFQVRLKTVPGSHLPLTFFFCYLDYRYNWEAIWYLIIKDFSKESSLCSMYF